MRSSLLLALLLFFGLLSAGEANEHSLPASGPLPAGSDRMDDFAFQMESGPLPVVGARLEDLAFQTHSVPASDIACVWIVRVPDAVDKWPEKWQDLAKWEKQSIDNPRTISELLALLSRSPDQDVARSSAPAWLLICARDKKGEWFFTRCLVYDKHAYNMPPSHPDEAGSHGGDICPEFVHFLKRMFPHLVRETKGHALAKKSSTQTRRRSYYRSGVLKTDTPLRNGKPHGEAVTYFSSGAVSMRIPYVEGVVHGRTRSYLENGQLLEEQDYVHGKLRIYVDGSVTHELIFENGKRVDAKVVGDTDGPAM